MPKKPENRRPKINLSLNLSEYIDTAINIDKMIASVEASADRFENSADNLNTGHIVKMAADNLLQNVAGEVKNVALNELNDEILSVLHPGIINIISGQEGGGLDGLLDMLISGSLDDYDGQFDIDDLRDRIKDRIKETLENQKDNWRGNLQVEIDAIIRDLTTGAQSEAEDLQSAGEEAATVEESEPANPYNDEELAASLADIPKDEHGCGPGYVWRRMSGIGCVQENCAEAGGHYSYTQACICSFVDSKPGDPTHACMRPANYLACPSCLYACVSDPESCPER